MLGLKTRSVLKYFRSDRFSAGLVLRAFARTELHNKQSSHNKVITTNTRVSGCIARANIYQSADPSGNGAAKQFVEDTRVRFPRDVFIPRKYSLICAFARRIMEFTSYR